jgi:hypothetical protein
MAIPQQTQQQTATSQDDWMLTPEQMLFMMQNHNVIERAFADDDLQFLRQFAVSEDFRTLFGDMGFDEAYDRYEMMSDSVPL